MNTQSDQTEENSYFWTGDSISDWILKSQFWKTSFFEVCPSLTYNEIQPWISWIIEIMETLFQIMFKFKMTYNMILNCLQIFLKETSRCDFFPALLVYTIVWITTLEMSWQMVKVVHIIMQKKNKYNKAVAPSWRSL